MKLRIVGFTFYFALYLLLYISYFGIEASWAAAVGAAASILFGALGGTGLGSAGRRMRTLYRIFAIAFVLVAVLALVELLPVHILIFCSGIGLVWLSIELWGMRRWYSRMVSYVFIAAWMISLPVPGLYTAEPSVPSHYPVSGKEGTLLAPNVKERLTSAGEWVFQSRNVDAASNLEIAINSDASGLSAEDFGDLFALPFDVPESYYNWDGAADDPHALIKTLALWNETSDIDVTQGQKVMGVGTVAPNGKILMVDDIEIYALAAIEEKPKVFFVPVEAYLQVRDLSKEQLVVPVSHFEEVLYFLSQPIEFWPLRNFGLFCH